MADEQKNKPDVKSEEKKSDKKKGKDKNKGASGGGLLVWILLGLGVAVLSGGAGAGASLLLNGGDEEIVGEGPAGQEPHVEEAKDFAYLPFESVTVNLNVRRGNRYLKVVMFLAVAQNEEEKIAPQIEKKSKEMKNWLMGYLRDHTLEEVSGKKNQVRIQREIAQSFNERLWPNSRPHIDHVLFDEFTIQ